MSASMEAIQRHRILTAAIEEVGDNYGGVPVARIIARASVSRRAFYDLFDNAEECEIAAFEWGAQRLRAAVERAVAEFPGIEWTDYLVYGTSTAIHFLEAQPQLARLLLVYGSSGGHVILRHREKLLGQVVSDVYAAIHGPDDQLRVHAVLNGAISILTGCVLRGTPLVDAYRHVIVMIAAPVLTRGVPAIPTGTLKILPAPEWLGELTPLAVPDAHASGPRLTARTVAVLHAIHKYPLGSNKEIAESVGITDQGQISKLLTRLMMRDLISNQGGDRKHRGAPNAWILTERGTALEHSLRIEPISDDDMPNESTQTQA